MAQETTPDVYQGPHEKQNQSLKGNCREWWGWGIEIEKEDEGVGWGGRWGLRRGVSKGVARVATGEWRLAARTLTSGSTSDCCQSRPNSLTTQWSGAARPLVCATLLPGPVSPIKRCLLWAGWKQTHINPTPTANQYYWEPKTRKLLLLTSLKTLGGRLFFLGNIVFPQT